MVVLGRERNSRDQIRRPSTDSCICWPSQKSILIKSKLICTLEKYHWVRKTLAEQRRKLYVGQVYNLVCTAEVT
jgi:hypothetical protein